MTGPRFFEDEILCVCAFVSVIDVIVLIKTTIVCN